jgi:hypothetical protein
LRFFPRAFLPSNDTFEARVPGRCGAVRRLRDRGFTRRLFADYASIV